MCMWSKLAKRSHLERNDSKLAFATKNTSGRNQSYFLLQTTQQPLPIHALLYLRSGSLRHLTIIYEKEIE